MRDLGHHKSSVAVTDISVIYHASATWREGINFRFELLLFTVLAQSVAAMIAVSCRTVGSVALNHDRTYWPRWFIQVNSRAGDSVFAIVFGCFSRITKLIGRTETRTRERMCFQTIQTV